MIKKNIFSTLMKGWWAKMATQNKCKNRVKGWETLEFPALNKKSLFTKKKGMEDQRKIGLWVKRCLWIDKGMQGQREKKLAKHSCRLCTTFCARASEAMSRWVRDKRLRDVMELGDGQQTPRLCV
jgi:tRNA(Ile)-lysidine synthase TilS/MesJ